MWVSVGVAGAEPFSCILRHYDAEGPTSARSKSRPVLRPIDGGKSPPLPTFEQLYREHAGYVATIVARLLGRPDDVEDVVHEAFLQARRALPKLRDARAAKGWLGTISVRVARRHLQRAKLRQRFGLGTDVDELSSARLSADDYAFVQSAYASLSRLSTAERIAWVLRRVHGAQLDAVASMCECSLATAKRRIAAADRKLEIGGPR